MARRKAPAFMKPVQADDVLGKVVGRKPITRVELTKRLWNYIKKNGLQDKKRKTIIHADAKLRPIFAGRNQVSMFDFTKLVSQHVISADSPSGYLNDLQEDAISDLELAESQLRRLKKTEREAIVRSRMGQGPWRIAVCYLWDQKCAVTGCAITPLLRASHIKPWRDSSKFEKLDKYNGLLLIPNLDLAFDKGFVSFNSKGQLLLSKKFTDADATTLGIKEHFRLQKVPAKTKQYLRYHQEHVFQR